MSDERRSEVDREKVLSRCQSEGCVLVVISAEPGKLMMIFCDMMFEHDSQVIFLPGPVWGDEDVIIVSAVTGLSAHVSACHLYPGIILTIHVSRGQCYNKNNSLLP